MPVTQDAFRLTPPNGFDFYLLVLEREFGGILYGTYIGGDQSQEHVDGGTSRFDKNGIVYQSVCAGCGGNDDFPTTPGAWSATNNSSNCNNAIYKFDTGVIPNAEFTTNQVEGCRDFTVTFDNSSSEDDTFLWDFGNGNTSNAFSPEPQLYDTAGVYMISLETRILDYILTNVNFTATGSNWCGDVEEVSLPFIGCTSSPDIYYQLTVSGSTQTSSSGDNSTNFSQSGMNSIITGSAFSIQFWDDDNGLPFGSPDDNLGTAVIQFTGPGTYPFNTNEGNGSVTIGTQVGLSFTNTDSVMVNASPASPVIFGTDTLFCAGDSAILTLPQAAFYQWSRDGIELLSANNDSLVAFDSGNYTAEIRSEQGCAAFSDTFTVQVEPYPYQPTFILNPMTETFFYNPGLPYNWVWLLDGDTLEGSENAINYQPLVPGNYSIVASNGYCESYSEAVFFTNVGIEALPAELDALIYPVPFHSGLLHIELKTVSTEVVHVNLYDSQGKLLQSQIYMPGSDVLNFNPGELSGGLYFLQIGSGGKSMMHKLPVSN
jgi:hypothetical protein